MSEQNFNGLSGILLFIFELRCKINELKYMSPLKMSYRKSLLLNNVFYK